MNVFTTKMHIFIIIKVQESYLYISFSAELLRDGLLAFLAPPPSEIIPFLLGTEKGAARLATWLTETRYFEDICPRHLPPIIN
jgi:hypothetical protein